MTIHTRPAYSAAQRAALDHPCRLAALTARSVLATQLSPTLSLVLSINTGYE